MRTRPFGAACGLGQNKATALVEVSLRRLLFACLLALPTASAHAEGAFSQCWGTAENTVAFEACLFDLKQKTDAQLAAAYAEAKTGLAVFDRVFGDDRVTRALARAQRSFELHRDLDCEVQGMMGGPGAAAGAFRQACWIDRTRARIAILEDMRPVPASEALAGDWRVLAIGEQRVLETAEVTLSFDAEGKIAGSGGCNRFFGTAELGEETLKFGPLGATRMACGDPLDAQEHKLLMALERVRRWSYGNDAAVRLEAVDGTLLVLLARPE